MRDEDWHTSAVCAQVDPEVFASDTPNKSFKAAARICAGCPVKRQCLKDAMDMGPSITGKEGGGYVMFQAGLNPRQLTLLYSKISGAEVVKRYDVDIDEVELCRDLVEGKFTSKQQFWQHVSQQIGSGARRGVRDSVRMMLTLRATAALEELPNVDLHHLAVAAGKLTEPAVREMRRMAAAGEGVTHIAELFGVGRVTAYDAIQGRTWKHVREEVA